MPTTRATRRRGPLTALEGAEPFLAIGDTAARHVRLSPEGLSRHIGEPRSQFVPWTQVHAVAVEPPGSWWPYPAISDMAAALLGGVAGGLETGDAAETPTFLVVITTLEGERLGWRATQHYLSGYRRRDAQATTRLVEYLAARSEARMLLARPAELIDRVSALTRIGPQVGP